MLRVLAHAIGDTELPDELTDSVTFEDSMVTPGSTILDLVNGRSLADTFRNLQAERLEARDEEEEGYEDESEQENEGGHEISEV